jgi:hypothetical protein
MTTQDAIQHYGSLKKLADALGIWPQAVYKWGEKPPLSKQYELEVKTDGWLRADRT